MTTAPPVDGDPPAIQSIDASSESTSIMERDTICFPQYGTRDVLQRGDADFSSTIHQLYHAAESNALEAVLRLKSRLRALDSNEDFCAIFTEGIAQILGAEMTFVMKRMLVDDHEVAVEMPPYGEPGSCMMAAAFHYCNPDGSRFTLKETKFFVYGCPCGYMRHDKVFLIPERLNEFITDNPNQLPTPAEAYMAVPLFADGKCFAHFGLLWSKDSAARRQLSWAFIEMLLHSFEDMVQQALIEGISFVRPGIAAAEEAPAEPPRVIPHDAVTVAQSLRPYAGSLSHELRTPMQGIVGMLDVMYATVQEAVATQRDPKLRGVFATLRENIEVVQDSSRRAVEAADNVVHAYDMDMSVPDRAPSALRFDDYDSVSPHPSSATDRRPEILVAGHDLPLARPNKRRRDEFVSRSGSEPTSAAKYQKIDDETASSAWSRRSVPSLEVLEGIHEADEIIAHARPGATPASLPSTEDAELASGAVHPAPHRNIAPGLRHTHLREVFRFVIDEGLKVGGRPDQFVATETAYGETISVRSRGSDGTTKTKTIEWRVDPNVPYSMFIDEKDLSKLISCVFRNAIKFTDQDGGHVSISARMSSRTKRYFSITIVDNGPGIPAAFLPQLFKAFSRDDQSITRSSEGLGLGLMVAKGIARKLGGDLVCMRSETGAENHGSEFEIKVPVMAGETITRPSSPFSSPRLSQVYPIAALGTSAIPPFQISSTPTVFATNRPSSPPNDFFDRGRQGTREARGSIEPLKCNTFPPLLPQTPPSLDDLTPATSPTSLVPLTTSTKPPTNTIQPLSQSQPSSLNSISHDPSISKPRIRSAVSNPQIDRDLASKYPLTFLVAEDNKINRKLLVSMLRKFGYTRIFEAHDGAEAVRQMTIERRGGEEEEIDVVLMDLWMPLMDGYEATERILRGYPQQGKEQGSETRRRGPPTVLAVSADCTDGALERAAQVGMRGFMTKPYKLLDLQRLITEYCASRAGGAAGMESADSPPTPTPAPAVASAEAGVVEHSPAVTAAPVAA